MIHEYLFLTDEHREAIETYQPPDGVIVEISIIQNTPLWIVTYFLDKKNEDNSKKLSDVHSFIMQYSPITLSCESSEYYNKLLFPLVNEFERKLRKLLYLAASISDNKAAFDTFRNLEEKTLGEIFNLLFVDTKFVANMKKRVNGTDEFNGQKSYSKAEIQEFLSGVEEHTLWDTLFNGSSPSTIRLKFREVFDYRNKVMHAHNIGRDLFGKARYLFDKINKELNSEIGKIIGQAENEPSKVKRNANSSISSALVAMDLSSLTVALKNATAFTSAAQALSETLHGIQASEMNLSVLDTMKRIQLTIPPGVTEVIKTLNSIHVPPGIVGTVTSLKGLQIDVSTLLTIQSACQQLSEALKSWSDLQKTIRSTTDANIRKIGLETDDNDDFATHNGQQEEELPNV